MFLITTLLLLLITGIFIYTWYEFRIALRSHKTSKKPTLNKNLKIIKKYLIASDGTKISSWYMPVKNPKAVIILIHGYRETNADKIRMLPHAEYLEKAGYSTLLIDLRSFGESQGDKITLGATEWKDIQAAYDYVKSLPENKNKKIGFYGKSMGGVTSIITKGITRKGDFIVALTPYASFKSLFKFQLKQKKYISYIFLPFLQIVAFFELGRNYEKHSPINLIKKINTPIFIVAAKYENRIPKNDAKFLFDHANNPKEFWEAPTNHDEIFRNNPTAFKRRVLNFLEKYI